MEGVIYLIKNNLNGHCYVGQTVKTAQRRWGLHKSESRNGSPYPLHAAMRRYGSCNFTVTILAIVETSKLDEMEIFYIDSLKTATYHQMGGYNATFGGGAPRGEGHAWFGKKHSEETKRKQAISKLGDKNHNFGKPATEKFRQAMSKRFKGVKLSDEHKNKISLAHMSENPTPKALVKRAWRLRRKSEGRSFR